MKRPITKEEADILISEPKYIDQEIKWTDDPNKEFVFEFRVPLRVSNHPNVKLILKGSTNIALQNHTFAIIYNGAARIKALDIGKDHPNRCPNHLSGWIGTKHKHTWQDCCNDKWAYVPDDITDGAPLEQVFREFLVECNINYDGPFPAFPNPQVEMILDELFTD